MPLAPWATFLFAEVAIWQALVAWIRSMLPTGVRIHIWLISARAIRGITRRATRIVAARPTVVERPVVAARPTVVERPVILARPTVVKRPVILARPTVVKRP